MATQNAQIQIRRDTAANWTSENPTLASGEIGFETDTNKLKIGDGATAWNAPLAYFGEGGGTPGGADTQIQFNDGGAFGGDANFTWDATNQILTIAGTAANPEEGYAVLTGVSDGSESYGLSIYGGNGATSGVNGGTLSAVGGVGNGNARGGGVSVKGGAGETGGGNAGFSGGACTDSGDGGSFVLNGGAGGTNGGSGGGAQFSAGDARGGDGNGGDVVIRAGAKNGTGSTGKIIFTNADVSGGRSVYDVSNLNVERIHTLPNKAGTFAMLDDTVTNGDSHDHLGGDGGTILFGSLGMNSLPVGTVVNYQIVPSVSSNNLTVALKGLDGNDPSATNPVIVRIGNVVRTVTAALSVTKNAGTNWFNSGAGVLATKEVDYFVYLGYNATDGITLGFARIPYATLYSAFSTTTTNEKYCAISVISNAAAGNDYVCIGRFAATLSATAAFNWSVPTYTTTNLIHRPIYETRWLTWAPTTTCSGSLTYSSITTAAFYKIRMNDLDFQLRQTGTLGGSASTGILNTLPFESTLAPSYNLNAGSAHTVAGLAGVIQIVNGTPDYIQLTRYDLGNFATSGTLVNAMRGGYQI